MKERGCRKPQGERKRHRRAEPKGRERVAAEVNETHVVTQRWKAWKRSTTRKQQRRKKEEITTVGDRNGKG